MRTVTSVVMEADSDDEDELRETVAAALDKIDPAFGYAHRKLGIIVSDENRHLFSPEDLAAWEQAVREWRSR